MLSAHEPHRDFQLARAIRAGLRIHAVLRASDRTLTDQDVKKFLERVEREAAALGGVLRRE
jgi:phenylalanyl-tRNA synthetase beta subunit